MNVILKRTSGLLDGSVERATSLLKAMANKHRLLVLIKLADREYSVKELEHVTGLGQSAFVSALGSSSERRAGNNTQVRTNRILPALRS